MLNESTPSCRPLIVALVVAVICSVSYLSEEIMYVLRKGSSQTESRCMPIPIELFLVSTHHKSGSVMSQNIINEVFENSGINANVSAGYFGVEEGGAINHSLVLYIHKHSLSNVIHTMKYHEIKDAINCPCVHFAHIVRDPIGMDLSA